MACNLIEHRPDYCILGVIMAANEEHYDGLWKIECGALVGCKGDWAANKEIRHVLYTDVGGNCNRRD